MHDSILQTVTLLLTEQPQLLQQPQRLEGVLADVCKGEFRREQAAIMQAVREGIPEKLLGYEAELPLEFQVAQFCEQLHEHQALDKQAAYHAVSFWIQVLTPQNPVLYVVPNPFTEVVGATISTQHQRIPVPQPYPEPVSHSTTARNNPEELTASIADTPPYFTPNLPHHLPTLDPPSRFRWEFLLLIPGIALLLLYMFPEWLDWQHEKPTRYIKGAYEREESASAKDAAAQTVKSSPIATFRQAENLREEARDRTQKAVEAMEASQRLLKSGAIREALEAIEAAATLLPENGQIYFLRGQILVRLKRFTDAVKDFDRCVTIFQQPMREFALAFYWRGVAKKLSGDPSAACLDFKVAAHHGSVEGRVELEKCQQ